MRQTGIAFTVEGFDLISPSSETEGELFIEGVAEFQVKISRLGDDLGTSFTSFDLRTFGDRVGGDIHRRSAPPEGGYLPDSFSDPFRVAIREQESEDAHDYLGQNALHVREFEPFLVDDANHDDGVMTRDRRGRLYSFNGALLFCCETFGEVDGRRLGYIRVYRFDESTRRFRPTHIFKDAVDRQATGEASQYGCPVLFDVGGSLHIAFRRLDRNTNRNFVEVYECTSDDFYSWTKKTRFALNGDAGAYDSFRMRAAVGAGAVMIVAYGVKAYKRTSGLDSEIQEFDAYISLDEGHSFFSRAESASNIRISRETNQLETAPLSMSLSRFFVPYVPVGTVAALLINYNVNFDLYFDRDMGSFVVVKMGDPPNFANDSDLIFVKTKTSSFLEWEEAARVRMNVRSNAEVSLVDGSYQYDRLIEQTEDENRYKLLDIEVVSGEAGNEIFFHASQQGSTYAFDDAYGVGLNRFRFVSNDLIPPGLYDRLYAFGVKTHPEYSLVAGVWNMQSHGVYGYGNHGGFDDPVSDLTACRHRGKLVYSDHIQYSYGYTRRAGLTYFEPWSNLGEVYGYQVSMPRFVPPGANYGFVADSDVSSSVTWRETSLLTEMDIGADSDVAFLEYKGHDDLDSPNLLERVEADGRDGSSSDLSIKARFELQVDSISGTLTVCRLSVTNGNGFDLRVNVTSANLVSLVQAGVGTIASATFPDLTSELHEFLVGVNENASGQTSAFLFGRKVGEPIWSYVAIGLVSQQAVATTVAAFGAYEGSTTGDFIKIGSIQISSYNRGYFHVEGSSATREGGFYEPMMGWLTEDIATHGSKTPGPIWDLYDGSELRFFGYQTPRSSTLFEVKRARGQNSLENLTDVLTSSVWHFSRYYDVIGAPSFVFQNNSGAEPDVLTLVNLYGVTSITVVNGDFDGSTWSNEISYTFMIPYRTVEFSTVNGLRGLLADSSEQPGSLEGWALALYDGDSGVYVDQYLIRDNTSDLISVDRTLVAAGVNQEYRLVHNVVSYDLPEDLTNARKEHWRVELSGPTSASLRHLGGILFGQFVDMTEHITTLEKTVSKDRNISDSPFGFIYNEYRGQKNLVESYEVEIGRFRKGSPEAMRIRGMIFDLHRSPRPNVFLEASEEGIESQVFSAGSSSTSPQGFVGSASFPVHLHQYRPDVEGGERADDLLLAIQLSKTSWLEGESGSATVTTDATAPSYLWTLPDGTTSAASSVPLQTDDPGRFLLTLTVTDSDGRSATARAYYFVVPAAIVEYDTVDDAGGSPASGVTYSMTITGKDSDGVAVDDSLTQVAVFGENVEFDLDGDASFGDATDVYGRLFQGELTFDFRGIAPGAGTVIILDQQGNLTTVSYTFS